MSTPNLVPLLVLLSACGSPQWKEAFDATGAGALSGVWGTGPDDVWMVGGSDAGGEAFHYDGSDWSPVDLPDGTPLLVWSYGFGPDDVYSVGLQGAVLHWDGSSWTPLDSGTDQELWGVFGFSNDDLWIVGGDPNQEDPLILHYDGSAFTVVPLAPEQNSRKANSLFKVWGIGDTLFAVGQRGLIVQYDGTEWREVSTGANADQDFVSLWGTSEDHIVAVGGRSNGRIATWDGSSWTTEALNGIGGMNAVFMDDPDEAVVGGVYGYVGGYDPNTGSLEHDKSPTDMDVHAIWGDGEGRYYGVGGRFRSPYEGVALVRRGHR